MYELAISLAKDAAQALLTTSTGIVAGKALVAFEKPLTELVPFLKRLGELRHVQMERALHCLEARVRRIEITHDSERLLGFANMCYRYFEAGAKEHREIKLKMLASACAHCASVHNQDPFDTELEFFDAVERLQPFHMHLLKHLDVHHSTKHADGHEHPASASYDEFMSAGFEIPSPARLWLTKALIALRDSVAIFVEGPGFGVRKGYTYPVTDATLVVQNGGIGLTSFGCRLLRYVEGAMGEGDAESSD